MDGKAIHVHFDEGKLNQGFDAEKDGDDEADGELEKFHYQTVHSVDINTTTYVYEPDKSLRRMTVEALPNEKNYQVY